MFEIIRNGRLPSMKKRIAFQHLEQCRKAAAPLPSRGSNRGKTSLRNYTVFHSVALWLDLLAGPV